MSEELEVLKIVAQRLSSADLPYMVTGSIALNFYSVPRMTRDIDLVIELSPPQVDKFCKLFTGDFYLNREAVEEAVRRPGVFNLIHNKSIVKVDFIVRKQDEYHREEFQRRRLVTIEGTTISLVSPEDLILSKLLWVRDTTPEVAELFHRRLMALSGQERLKMGCSMHETARRIVIASLRAKNPDIDQTELNQALFLRFYEKDLEPETVKKILQALSTGQ